MQKNILPVTLLFVQLDGDIHIHSVITHVNFYVHIISRKFLKE